MSKPILAIRFLYASLFVLCTADVYASPTIGQLCQMHTAGVMISMKTWLDLKMPANVAMQNSGYAPNGPRYKMAELGYSQLKQGKPEAQVEKQVNALCLTFKPNDIIDDEPIFDKQERGNANLCGDIATSITGSVDSLGPQGTIKDAMNHFLHQDNRPQPRLRTMVQFALDAKKHGKSTTEIADALMTQCEKLKPEEKNSLGKEFYAE
jgi:hypothetical protein